MRVNNKQLHTITRPKRYRTGESIKAFNPLSEEDQWIFKSLLSGADTINYFRNQEHRLRLANSPLQHSCERCLREQSAKMSRLLKRLNIYGLIAKISRSRRWPLSKKGWALLSAAVTEKEHVFPVLYEQAGA